MEKEIQILNVRMGNPPETHKLSVTEAKKLVREYLQAGRYGICASIAMQISEQLPNELWPHLRAAESLLMNQQLDSAFLSIDRALAIDPRNIASLIIKSRLYLTSGDQQLAVQSINYAASLTPGNSYLIYEKAELLTETGHLTEARESYLKSIELDPRNTDSLLGLSRLPGDNFTTELLKKVEFLIQSRQLNNEDQIKAHFALAHAYENKTDTVRQFAHLKIGNELKSKAVKYSPSASRQEIRQTIEYFSKYFFSKKPIEGGNPARIIFIIGFPRCGSTLVEQILTSHPDVSGGGELFALRQSIQKFQQSRRLMIGYPYWIDDHSAKELSEIADDYLLKTRQFSRGTYITDKQLPNFMFVGLIHLIFPNAKIINVQRNPIDVCYSGYKRLFKLNSLPYMYNLEHLASRYRDYRKIMDHWNKVLPGKIHTVEYEQLINNQKNITADLLEHCDLPWHEACLNFHENERSVLTHSNTQVRQKLYTESIDRWKAYKDYLEPLLSLTNS